MIVHHQSNTYFQFGEINVVARQTSVNQDKTKAGRAFYVLLPLQSTIGDMHTIKTIDVSLHKQRVIYAYTC